MPSQNYSSVVQQLTLCLLPLVAGFGTALLLLVLAGGPARPAYAGTLTYPGCGATVQDCINTANAGDTILIQAGNYTESLTLSKAVSLTGELSSTTILHALPGTRVLTVTGAAVDASVVISGLTFTGGNVTGTAGCPDGCGGGIYVSSLAQPRLRNLTLIQNSAYAGGGLFNYGNATLTYCTIMSNTAFNSNSGGIAGGGGGVFNSLGTLTITASSITNNSNAANSYVNEDGGGGVYNLAGAMTITGSSIASNNSATTGGGVYNLGGTLTITSSLITSNTANDSAGVSNYLGTLTITSSSLTSNTASTAGGGLGNYGGSTLTIDSSTITSNAATDGGGVYDWSGTLTINSSSVINNAATYGGGVFDDNLASTSRIVNALIAGNSASQQGAALYMLSPGSVTILYSTIASPTLGTGAAIVVTAGTLGITDTIIASYTTGISQTAGSVFEDNNLFFGNGTNISGTVSSGAHSLTGNPAFVNSAAGDYHLSSGSLAIDAGTDAGVTTDFFGNPRPQGAGFDIGFDESPFTAVADVGLTKSASDIAGQPGQALTYTLVFSNAGPQVAASVRLTDIVPANLTAISYTSSGAALTPVGLGHYTWQVADLLPGAGGVVTITGMLGGGQAGTVFTNTATISSSSSDTNPANNTSAASVKVIVPPVAVDDAYAMPANGTLTVTAPGVLANDTDANHFPLTAVLLAGPPTVIFHLHSDGSFTYTPPHNFVGMVTFTYQAYDGHAYSNIATVTITVAELKLYLPVVRR